jgi:hypothetical protein
MKMENVITTSGVAMATDGQFRPADSATDPRPLAVGAAEGLAMTAEGMRMQQGLAPSAAERPLPLKVKAPAVHLLLARILHQIEPISGRKHTELNRQIRGVECPVTYRKQSATTCSNSQKNQKWTSAFLPEVAQGRMLSFSLCSRQTILPEGGKL